MAPEPNSPPSLGLCGSRWLRFRVAPDALCWDRARRERLVNGSHIDGSEATRLASVTRRVPRTAPEGQRVRSSPSDDRRNAQLIAGGEETGRGRQVRRSVHAARINARTGTRTTSAATREAENLVGKAGLEPATSRNDSRARLQAGLASRSCCRRSWFPVPALVGRSECLDEVGYLIGNRTREPTE